MLFHNLDRYYIAEGVKLYSQETWRRATAGRGVALVEKHLDKVVDFYVSQSEASNHAVREASCTCIAELGTKVSMSPSCSPSPCGLNIGERNSYSYSLQEFTQYLAHVHRLVSTARPFARQAGLVKGLAP